MNERNYPRSRNRTCMWKSAAMNHYPLLFSYMDLQEALQHGRSSRTFEGRFQTVAVDLTGHGKHRTRRIATAIQWNSK